MIFFALRRSFGSDSERISCRTSKIAPATAVATYTQKERYRKQREQQGDAQFEKDRRATSKYGGESICNKCRATVGEGDARSAPPFLFLSQSYSLDCHTRLPGVPTHRRAGRTG